MAHQRDYSEEVAALVDEEVKKLIETAHNEAWEILVENRDVLDNLVLQLLEKETLGKEEIAEIFATIVKRPARPAWTGSTRRTPSTRPPVLSPKELSLTNGANGSPAASRHRPRERFHPGPDEAAGLPGGPSRGVITPRVTAPTSAERRAGLECRPRPPGSSLGGAAVSYARR